MPPQDIPNRWSQELYTETMNFIKKQKDDFNNQATVLETQAPRAAMELQGAQSQIDSAKRNIQGTINSIGRKTDEVKSIVNRMSKTQSEATKDLEILRRDVVRIEKEVQDQRVLSSIRKEQAESLMQKRVGNLRSSWMGLFRPMKDTSRFGILVLTITLLVIFVIMGVYAYMQGYFAGLGTFLWEKLKSSGGLVLKSATTSAALSMVPGLAQPPKVF